jgi:hypothetical protein
MGRAGGKKRAQNMAPTQRSDEARKAAEARWGEERRESSQGA